MRSTTLSPEGTALKTILVVAAICAACVRPAIGAEDRAIALEQTVQRVFRGADLWPGFDPLSVPLGVYDGERTYLFRHPSPPEEFVADGDHWVFEGRYPSITANSSTQLGGVSTATVMLETLPPDGSPRDRAALVAHEGFHVFQGTTGRRWGADESALFTYPADDARLLALRRLETEALRNALAAGDRTISRRWADGALHLRAERFALMDSISQVYERGMEAMEGTAYYVESKVAGRDRPDLPAEGFDAADVRRRAYQTGMAWSLLLDRFSPGWRVGFGSDSALSLDAALTHALGGASGGSSEPVFTAAERAAAQQSARGDVGRVLADRDRRREEFESTSGWRVVIEAGESGPLWPQGFDPLNVRLVRGGVLHSRFLKLGNASGRLEMMDLRALTESAGSHPLFDGVSRVIVTGFESTPVISESGGTVTIRSDGFTAEFEAASVVRGDREITVRLGPAE
jgi:hypothetical protein